MFSRGDRNKIYGSSGQATARSSANKSRNGTSSGGNGWILSVLATMILLAAGVNVYVSVSQDFSATDWIAGASIRDMPRIREMTSTTHILSTAENPVSVPQNTAAATEPTGLERNERTATKSLATTHPKELKTNSPTASGSSASKEPAPEPAPKQTPTTKTVAQTVDEGQDEQPDDRTGSNNSILDEIIANFTEPKIKLFKSQKEMDWFRKRAIFFRDEIIVTRKIRSFYSKATDDPLSRSGDPDHYYAIDQGNNTVAAKRIYDENKLAEFNKMNNISGRPDPSEGPYLDFMVAGNPKCGTTTLMANLRRIAPMPVKDVCTGATHTLRFAYLNWPNDPNCNALVTEHLGPDQTRWMRGSKCPRLLNSNLLLGHSALLPSTKLIIGIRHPVLWFSSFSSMREDAQSKLLTTYDNIELCKCPVNPLTGVRPRSCDSHPDENCFGECRCGALMCLHRSRLHLTLARLGKTALSKEELKLLAPNDNDGGENLFNAKIRNPVFVYDLTQMRNDTYWEDLAGYLGVSNVPNHDYRGSHGVRNRHKNLIRSSAKDYKKENLLCDPHLDFFRSKIMAYSYELGMWIQNYWLPVAADPDRPDVVVAGGTSNTSATDEFWAIAETYKVDPCGRLVRRPSDGLYVLRGDVGDETNSTAVEFPTGTAPLHPVYGHLNTTAVPQCRSHKKAQQKRTKDEKSFGTTGIAPSSAAGRT